MYFNSEYITRDKREDRDRKHEKEFESNVCHETDGQKGQHHKLEYEPEAGKKLHRHKPSYESILFI